jgi:hypothetical protein
VSEYLAVGRQLREATQRRRAAHLVEASVLLSGQDDQRRSDRVVAHAEACCRRSPPPATPNVDERALSVMYTQLIARDEEHFAT